MWERGTLKARAKEAFKANYWKCVLVSIVLGIALGGAGGSSSGSSSSSMDRLKEDLKEINQSSAIGKIDGNGITFQEDGKIEFGGVPIGEYRDDDDDYEYHDDSDVRIDEVVRELKRALDQADLDSTVLVTIFAILFVAILAAIVVSCLLSAFLFNPLQIGCRRFFYKNLNEDATLKELGAGFENSYLNKVKVMFLVDLSCFLWGLLLIIPGIIKRYEYRMVVYLLGEDPTMTTAEAKAKSREMMNGQKWAAFVLDLSFIGWMILGIFTCGILYPFYVNPYMYQTQAALFEELYGGANAGRIEQIDYSAPVE